MTKRNLTFGKEFMRFSDRPDAGPQPTTRSHRASAPVLSDPKVEAARKRLRESVEAAETLEAIREIVSNLLGCETMGLYRFDRKKGVLWLFWSFGLDSAKHTMIDALQEPALSCVAEGSTYIAKDLEARSANGRFPKVSVFVPIRCGGEITAVLALLQFLPQKQVIEDIDKEIFQILSEESGSKLFGPEGGVVAPATQEQKS